MAVFWVVAPCRGPYCLYCQGDRSRTHRRDNLKSYVCGMDSSVSEYGPVAGSCGHGNEHDLIQCGEFLDWLNDC
jgi:hypothetical protein